MEQEMPAASVRVPPPPNNLELLDPERIRLDRGRPGQMILTFTEDGQSFTVKPIRTFPVTDPDHYISLIDENENEIGVIENPERLDDESGQILRRLLDETYFLPNVEKIDRITEDFGVYRWDVQTNKGPRTFEVRGRDDVRIIAGGHVIVRDIDGNRYHILSINRLDNESRLHLDALL